MKRPSHSPKLTHNNLKLDKMMKKYGPIMPSGMERKRKATKSPAAKKTKKKSILIGTGPIGEAKYVDTGEATYACDTTGTITHVSIVPQGATAVARDGRTCEITACHIRGLIQSNSTTTITSGTLLLVWDQQPNKALAAIDDILDGKKAHLQNKRENANRFRILMRRDYALIGNTTTAGQATSASGYRVEEYIRLPKGCICVYTTADTTGAIANCIQGALLFVSIGQTAAGNSAAAFYGTLRTSFRDI